MTSPFHSGEQALQQQIGKRDKLEAYGQRAIRDHMPEQHRTFFQQLPFVVAGAADDQGRLWAGLIGRGAPFLASPDPRHLVLEVDDRPGDPLRRALTAGRPLGLLGLEYHSRRRNRVNGQITHRHGADLTFAVDQSFGNCPQYIQTRAFAPVAQPPGPISALSALTGRAAEMIASAEHMFVASALPGEGIEASADVSHRGGNPGFLQITGNSILVPEFSGNNHFNTLGNFLLNPRAGLLVPDFTTGDLLSLTGRVEVMFDPTPEIAGFDGAIRSWRFDLEEGVLLKGSFPLRAEVEAVSPQTLRSGTWAGNSGNT